MKEILRTPLTAEQKLEGERIYRAIIKFRQWPDIATSTLTGIFLPVHQRIMLYVAHLGSPSTVFVCSRGTSKSALVDVVYATYKSILFPKRKAVTLSHTGFRGGQMLYNDLEAWVRGNWVDQTPGYRFFEKSIKSDKIVTRMANYWQVSTTSASLMTTLPTNDPDKIRGIRGTDLYLDEVNFMDESLMTTVSESFLNVLADFKTGGENAATNSIFYTSTVDYGWRPFYKLALSAYDSMERDYAAWKAREVGDVKKYSQYERKGLLNSIYVSFDYTDLLIRRDQVTRAGEAVRIVWPDRSRTFKYDPRGVPFTHMGANGRLELQGRPCHIISVYPINRNVENKLLEGVTSEGPWMAEQRNVVDTSAGDVYPHHIVDLAECKGSRFVIPFGETNDAWQKQYAVSQEDYTPTVMWNCTDPCVLGVDYAPGSRDFSAFVVMRAGPCALNEFDPTTSLGKTTWSNVVWAEQHRHTSHADVANKIREYSLRYNLVYHYDEMETDTWNLCRAIGLDMRGGGTGVRDELVHINKDHLVPGEYRIYDPLDSDERVQGFTRDAAALPMLDAIFPTDQLNDKLVEYTSGQMTQGMLYLAKYLDESQRPYDAKLDIGFNGVRMLAHQLRVLQQKPTKNYRNFFVSGNTEDATRKKDLWAAFIYAAKQLRAHILRQRLMDNTPPPMGGVITRIGGRSNGRFRIVGGRAGMPGMWHGGRQL